MTLTSALIVPGSHFLIRSEITASINIDSAGYWEALNRISNYYMLIITSVVSMYYLPKLSSIHTNNEFKKELNIYFKTLVPIFIIIVILVYLMREQIVLIILNNNFLPVADLFLWQIIGDTLNVFSLAFGYQILAKAMTKTYIFIEILYYTIYLLLIFFLLPKLKLDGVVMSYAFTNFVSLIVMLFLFRKTLLEKKN
jgi:PST family polysaccharide transporter